MSAPVPASVRQSKSRAMVHQPVQPKPQAIISVPAAVNKAANFWSGAYLPGHCLEDLEKALSIVVRHPDSAGRGYSKAKDARTRLEFEINRLRAAKN